MSSPKLPGLPKATVVVVCLQYFFAVNLDRCCPATTLADHNKYFIITVFGEAWHNSTVSFLQTDLLASHKQKSQIYYLQVQVKSDLSEFQVKSQVMKIGDSNQPLRL